MSDIPADTDAPPEITSPASSPEKLSPQGVAAMQGEETETASLAQETKPPVNGEYAGRVFSLADSQHPELEAKYPEGVKFDEAGYPDFSPYALETVNIDMRGDHYHDYKAANAAAGLEDTPDECTWHHHQDGQTMLLLPTDLHEAVRHSGGVSIIKAQNKEAEA